MKGTHTLLYKQSRNNTKKVRRECSAIEHVQQARSWVHSAEPKTKHETKMRSNGNVLSHWRHEPWNKRGVLMGLLVLIRIGYEQVRMALLWLPISVWVWSFPVPAPTIVMSPSTEPYHRQLICCCCCCTFKSAQLWKNKLLYYFSYNHWYIHTVKYYMVRKRNKLLLYATTWTNLKTIKLDGFKWKWFHFQATEETSYWIKRYKREFWGVMELIHISYSSGGLKLHFCQILKTFIICKLYRKQVFRDKARHSGSCL